jgi:hypothetical protein
MNGKGWDDYSFEKAKTLYLDGVSMAQISQALVRDGYNISRSAVIGKMNRMGVADGRTIIKRADGLPKAPRVPKPPRVIEIAKPTKPLPIIGAEKAMQYIGPIGTTPAWGFCQFTRDDVSKPGWQMCGLPAVVRGTGRNKTQSPWCEEHGCICHQPQQSNKSAGKDAA